MASSPTFYAGLLGFSLALVFLAVVVRIQVGPPSFDQYTCILIELAPLAVYADMIQAGYGFVYTRFPFKYMDEFRWYEREAGEQDRGLWGRST